MSEIFIHIGMDKTATKSIQRYLELTYCFKDAQIYYPQVPRAMRPLNHEILTAIVVSENDIPEHTLQVFKGHENAFCFADSWLNDLYRLWEERKYEKIILSSEAFYSLPYYGVMNLKKLASRFDGAKINIICSVDSPSSRFRSQLCQSIVDGFGMCAPHAQQVSQYIDRYRRVFGADCISILDFDESKRLGNVLHDFLYKMGISVNVEPIEIKENATMSAEALQLALDLDKSMPRYRRFEELARLFFVDQLVSRFSSPVLREEVSNFVDVVSVDYDKLSNFLTWRPTENEEISPDVSWQLPCEKIEDIFVFNRDRYIELYDLFHHGVEPFGGY